MIQPDSYVRSLLKRSPGETVTARGWVKTRRDSKNVHFVQLNDGSSTTDLQVVLEHGVVPADVVARITTGACISVEGELVASPGKGQAVELKARTLTLHGAADPEHYPLQKKKHTLETLREIGHLRTRSNTFGAVFRVRNALDAPACAAPGARGPPAPARGRTRRPPAGTVVGWRRRTAAG